MAINYIRSVQASIDVGQIRASQPASEIMIHISHKYASPGEAGAQISKVGNARICADAAVARDGTRRVFIALARMLSRERAFSYVGRSRAGWPE